MTQIKQEVKFYSCFLLSLQQLQKRCDDNLHVLLPKGAKETFPQISNTHENMQKQMRNEGHQKLNSS